LRVNGLAATALAVGVVAATALDLTVLLAGGFAVAQDRLLINGLVVNRLLVNGLRGNGLAVAALALALLLAARFAITLLAVTTLAFTLLVVPGFGSRLLECLPDADSSQEASDAGTGQQPKYKTTRARSSSERLREVIKCLIVHVLELLCC
jgi:hypothetical protein